VTLGYVETGLYEYLIAYFREQYGLEVLRGPAIAAPTELLAERGRIESQKIHSQLDTDQIAWFIEKELADFPAADKEGLSIILITPIDVYIGDNPNWRWAFGAAYNLTVPRAGAVPAGVISYFRMDERIYSYPYDEELFLSRVRKMVSKYIGMLHYGLETSPNPRSPMFNGIGGLDDLDYMDEGLPVP
jgi:predicted Zn-dependent protease